MLTRPLASLTILGLFLSVASAQPWGTEWAPKNAVDGLFGNANEQARAYDFFEMADQRSRSKLEHVLLKAAHEHTLCSKERLAALYELAALGFHARNHLALLVDAANTCKEPYIPSIPLQVQRLVIQHPDIENVRTLFRLSCQKEGLRSWPSQFEFFLLHPELTLAAIAKEGRPSRYHRELQGEHLELPGMWFNLYGCITECDFELKRSRSVIKKLMRSRDLRIRLLARQLFREVDPRHNIP